MRLATLFSRPKIRQPDLAFFGPLFSIRLLFSNCSLQLKCHFLRQNTVSITCCFGRSCPLRPSVFLYYRAVFSQYRQNCANKSWLCLRWAKFYAEVSDALAPCLTFASFYEHRDFPPSFPVSCCRFSERPLNAWTKVRVAHQNCRFIVLEERAMALSNLMILSSPLAIRS